MLGYWDSRGPLRMGYKWVGAESQAGIIWRVASEPLNAAGWPAHARNNGAVLLRFAGGTGEVGQ